MSMGLIINMDDFSEEKRLNSHQPINQIVRHAYRNKMVHGIQWATSIEISVATRIGELEFIVKGLDYILIILFSERFDWTCL
jgi:hypothetical protein